MAQLGSKIKNFLKIFKSEFKQIIWPKKEQIFKKTLVVIFVAVMLTIIILSFDAVYAIINSYLAKKFI